MQDTLIAKYETFEQTAFTYYRSEFPDGLEEAFSTLYAVAKSDSSSNANEELAIY